MSEVVSELRQPLTDQERTYSQVTADIARPLEGRPVVRVRCQPVYDYGRVKTSSWAASNHVEYTGLPTPLCPGSTTFTRARGWPTATSSYRRSSRPSCGSASRG